MLFLKIVKVPSQQKDWKRMVQVDQLMIWILVQIKVILLSKTVTLTTMEIKYRYLLIQNLKLILRFSSLCIN